MTNHGHILATPEFAHSISKAISGNDLREIRECIHKGWALGNERSRGQIEALGQRRATSKGMGRTRQDKKTCLTPVFGFLYARTTAPLTPSLIIEGFLSDPQVPGTT